MNPDGFIEPFEGAELIPGGSQVARVRGIRLSRVWAMIKRNGCLHVISGVLLFSTLILRLIRVNLGGLEQLNLSLNCLLFQVLGHKILLSLNHLS